MFRWCLKEVILYYIFKRSTKHDAGVIKCALTVLVLRCTRITVILVPYGVNGCLMLPRCSKYRMKGILYVFVRFYGVKSN